MSWGVRFFSRTCTYSSSKFQVADRYLGSEKNIWVLLDSLNDKYNPINFDGGNPNYGPDRSLIAALKEASDDKNWQLHQYARSFGHPRLVEAISSLYSPIFQRKIDPYKEILVTIGGQEALNCAILSHINPGDEVILIEPAYNCYEPLVRSCGGILKIVAVRPASKDGAKTSSDFVFDKEELSKAFNAKTKMIIINTPQNPIGKIYSKEECQFIADLCKKWDVICVSDDVYEWLVYRPNKMFKMGTLPDMWDRTLTTCSIGKVFHITGWKIGWVYGPPNLIKNLTIVHQHSVYACSTFLQEVVAICLENETARLGDPECLLTKYADELKPKIEFVADCLKEIGMKPIMPQGGYFVLADWTPLEKYIKLPDGKDPKDLKLCKHLIENIKFSFVPPSAFYGKENEHLGEIYIRLSIIRDMKTLIRGMDILKNWRKTLK